MALEIRRTTEGNYLVITPGHKCDENFETRIFRTCRIPGLLPCRAEFTDGKCFYLYNISSMISLGSCIETGNVTCENIRTILINILNSISTAREYMLSEDHIRFSPEYIFVSPYDHKIGLCFDPASDNDFRISFIKLMEYLTDHIYRYDREGAMLVFRVLKAVSSGNRSVEDLKELLYRDPPKEDPAYDLPYEIGEPPEQYPDEPADEPLPDSIVSRPEMNVGKVIRTALPVSAAALAFILLLFAVRFDIITLSKEATAGILTGITALVLFCVLMKKRARNRKDPAPEKDTGDHGSFPLRSDPGTADDIEILYEEEDSATMLISDAPPRHALIRPFDSAYPQRVLGTKPVVIGKMKDLCDLTIDSPVVSRMHARIFPENGEFFIQDLNSRNGTYLNDELLPGKEKRRLSGGDIIRFADVSYVFDFSCERT